MVYLEIIVLRSGSSWQKKDAQVFLEKMCGNYPVSGSVDIKIYHNAELEGDISIHIHTETEPVEGQKSQLGLYLAGMLKELGLVNHSVWIEA